MPLGCFDYSLSLKLGKLVIRFRHGDNLFNFWGDAGNNVAVRFKVSLLDIDTMIFLWESAGAIRGYILLQYYIQKVQPKVSTLADAFDMKPVQRDQRFKFMQRVRHPQLSQPTPSQTSSPSPFHYAVVQYHTGPNSHIHIPHF